MSKREINIAKAQENGYFVDKIGSMFFVMDDMDNCHGYFDEEKKAYNKLARIGKGYN